MKKFNSILSPRRLDLDVAMKKAGCFLLFLLISFPGPQEFTLFANENHRGNTKYSLSGYFRGSLLVGENGKMGVDPSEELGSPMEITLFDEPYLELMGTYHDENSWSLHTQVAVDNENLFHITGDPENVHWVIRDFYLEKKYANQSSLWVGSRKYHRIEEHNFFGVGIENLQWWQNQIGIAYGARQDFGYYGAKWEEINKAKRPLRQTIILDITRPLAGGHFFQVVMEKQSLGESQAVSQEEKIKYSLAPLSGWSAGISLYSTGTLWDNFFAVTYSHGDFIAAALARTNTQGSPTFIYDSTGEHPLMVGWYRQDNARITFFDVGKILFPLSKWQLDYKFAYIYDQLKTSVDKKMALYQLIPAINIADDVKLALDMSYTRLFGYRRPDLFILAPQIILQNAPKNNLKMTLYCGYGNFPSSLVGLRFDGFF